MFITVSNYKILASDNSDKLVIQLILNIIVKSTKPKELFKINTNENFL